MVLLPLMFLTYFLPIFPLDGCELLCVPRFCLSSSMGVRSFSVLAPKLWNSLPLTFRTSTSIYEFKSQLKTYLFAELISHNVIFQHQQSYCVFASRSCSYVDTVYLLHCLHDVTVLCHGFKCLHNFILLLQATALALVLDWANVITIVHVKLLIVFLLFVKRP